MSFKPQVQISGEEGWKDNALRFATEDEAARYAAGLYSRWALTTAHQAAPSDDPVNYRLADDGSLERAEV